MEKKSSKSGGIWRRSQMRRGTENRKVRKENV